MSEVRQCWAFHRDGMRCEHPAGHPGNHAITKEWTDIECATPGEFDITTPEPVYPAPPPLAEGPIKCVACNHAHAGKDCKCGCYEFIG